MTVTTSLSQKIYANYLECNLKSAKSLIVDKSFLSERRSYYREKIHFHSNHLHPKKNHQYIILEMTVESVNLNTPPSVFD